MSYFRGDDFRQDYAKLGMPCATFPNVPVIAITGTANKLGREHIKESLSSAEAFKNMKFEGIEIALEGIWYENNR
jgi:superfamily II DNA helicase RecQ